MRPFLYMSTLSNGEKMSEVFHYQPIGFFKSDKSNNYDVPRQAGLDDTDLEKPDYIELIKGHQFEQALEDLSGFTRLWLLFEFHKNSTWNPKVMPPRGGDSKRGVFATRSPYRPNPIGISCVELIRISGLKIYVSSTDLLNETPILDIKPYIPEYDAFPEAKTGWLEDLNANKYDLTFSTSAVKQMNFLQVQGKINIEAFIKRSLEFDPLNKEKKRLLISTEQHLKDKTILCYRTWRISFQVNEDLKRIQVYDIFSGYSESELSSIEDPYQDKAIHREYLIFLKS